MLPADRKPVSGEKNLSTLVRCALILKWVCRRAGFRALANLALIVVLFGVAHHVRSEILKDVLGIVCLFLIYRPLVYLLMAIALLVKLGPDKGPTESQSGRFPDGVESQKHSQ